MAEEIGTLVARVVADNEQFRSDMVKMSRTLETNTAKMNSALARVNSSFGSLSSIVRRLGPILGIFGVSLSAVGFVRFAKDAIAAGDALDNVSRKAGVSAETLQQLRYAFSQLSDLTDNEVDDALEQFSRRLGDAIQGTGEAATVLRNLGVNLTTTSGAVRSTSDVLDEALRSLAGVQNEAVRAAQAADLFGRSAGPGLAAALGQGIDKMEELRQVTPGVISNENVRLAAELHDEFDRIARTVGGPLKDSFIAAAAAAGDFLGVVNLSEVSKLNLEIMGLEHTIASLERSQARGRREPLLEPARQQLAELERQRQIAQATESGVGGFATWPPGIPTPEQAAAAAAESAAAADAAWRTTLQNLIAEFDILEQQRIQQEEMQRASADAAKLAHEAELQKQRELTEAIRAEHDERMMIVAEAAAQETMAVLESQQQQLEFRSSMAQAIAGLAHAVFGEQKAVALAAIAFEKLTAVRRIKIATEQAAMLAFASQLVPGDPTSFKRAKLAMMAVRAMGTASMAQTVALSVVEGLGEAARVVGSSGAPGSFTNPLSVAAGSSTAGGAIGTADHTERMVQIIFKGDVYGWDSYIQHQIMDGLRTAFRDRDVVIIDPTSRQGQVLGAPV